MSSWGSAVYPCRRRPPAETEPLELNTQSQRNINEGAIHRRVPGVVCFIERFPLNVVVLRNETKARRVCIVLSYHLFLDGSSRGLDVVGEPGQAFQQTLTTGGAAGHDIPDLVLELGELESVGDFLG